MTTTHLRLVSTVRVGRISHSLRENAAMELSDGVIGKTGGKFIDLDKNSPMR